MALAEHLVERSGDGPRRKSLPRGQLIDTQYKTVWVNLAWRSEHGMDLRQFYEEQLDLIRNGDVTALVEKHYHPDAVLVTPERVVKGHAALKEMFQNYLPSLGKLAVNTEAFVETENVCLIEAEIDTGRQSRRVYDAFVLKDGRIIHHFAGVFR